MIAAADRHLLFGLLALQNGIIDQGQLVAAFQAWTLEKSRRLADHLEARGDLTGDRRAVLERLVEVHLEAHGGDVQQSLAAVSVGKSTRDSLARLGDPDIDNTLGHVAHSHVLSNDDRTASYTVGTATSDSQRFRVLRPHARGGLGTVFVALDNELHREVALKQMLDHHADDPRSRQRFLVEAEITGGLEHPGIVPVYGLGTYACGRPYYAMRFVKGDSLKEAIEAFHQEAHGNAHLAPPGRGPHRMWGVRGRRSPGSAFVTSPALRSPSPRAGEGDESGTPDGRTGKAPTPSRALALRNLLRRFTDVCNAIEYAHSRGVLHRDIKPGNIIVGKHGETLVVDWGLAKPLGRVDPAHAAGERTLLPSSASGSADTLPGSALGTPAYMSPEQAAGELDRLGPRSDVYSLGATLYCLLTGKPPHAGGDIGEVLRKVQRGEFPTPRQIDSTIDPALEAVCLKAMATGPVDRYGSARALVDEVERWMADEPVSAWREPLLRRAQRWARRNRPLMMAAAAAVLVALAGLGAVLAVQRGANRVLAARNSDLDRANTSLQEAIQQQDAANVALADANMRVHARFELAREAIRSFKEGVEEEEALKENRLRPLRDKLLGSARRFYDKLGDLLKGQSDTVSKAVLAESYMELGELILRIGQMPEARAARKKAVAIRRELAAQPGTGTSELVKLAQALNGLGEVAFDVGDHAGSLAAHEEARALAEPLAAGTRATIEARRAFGSAQRGAGAVLLATGKFAEALADFRTAREVGEALARDVAAVPDDRKKLAVTFNSVGDLLERTGDLAGALAEYRKGQELMRVLAAEHPAVPDYRHNLADSHNKVGGLLEATGDLAGALADYRKDLELMRTLAAEHPAVLDYRRALSFSQSRVGDLVEKTGDLAGALAERRKAQELRRALAAEYAGVPDYRRDLALSHNRVGILLEKTGDLAGALAEYRNGQELCRALAAEHREVPDYRRELAVGHNRVGGLLEKTGDLAGALAEQRRYQALMRALATEHPDITNYRHNLAVSHDRIGSLLERIGELAGALAEYRKGQELMRSLGGEHPEVPGYRRGLAVSHIRVGNLLTTAGKPAEALAEQERARSLFEALAQAGPSVPDYRDALAFALNCAGDALRDLGRSGEARDRHAQAIALAEALASAFPKVPAYRARLADGLRRLARLNLDAGNTPGADADARRAITLFEGLPSRDGRDWFWLACARATLAAANGRGGAGTSAALEPSLTDQAMSDVRRAVAAGYRSPAVYRYEPALGPLRRRDDFRLLMMDLAMPASPFGPAR
jgi:serine/threonine protein kinase/tetratricopeptide (TPR) repeat protein